MAGRPLVSKVPRYFNKYANFFTDMAQQEVRACERLRARARARVCVCVCVRACVRAHDNMNVARFDLPVYT